MIKRLICLILALVLFIPVAYAKKRKPKVNKEDLVAQRYDFDLTFSLDPEAFPARSRSRARGYAEMLDALRFSGDVTICEATQSFDMNATVFFRKKPDVSIPFRFYGVPGYLFLTSPLLGGETLLFNMRALAEFSIKVKKSLDTPIPAVALLYPFVYEFNFYNVWKTWDEFTGPKDVSREISPEQISRLADAWMELLENDTNLNVWMQALYSICSAPEAVEAEINGVPSYLNDFVSAGGPLTVDVGEGTETWHNAAGLTLYSSEKSDSSQQWSLNLPPDENRYAVSLTWNRSNGENAYDFSLDGSMLRKKGPALPPGLEEEEGFAPVTGGDGEEEAEESYPITGSEEENESESESEYEDEESDQWPETMIQFSVTGASFPNSYPSDSNLTLTAYAKGVLFPNFDLSVSVDTKKDGTVSASLSVPLEEGKPVQILSAAGTITAGTAETVPDFNYSNKQLYGNYNFFSFSEYYLDKFKNAVTKPLLKGLLDFVAEAPTSACQALLDDLTDAGVINMMFMGQ